MNASDATLTGLATARTGSTAGHPGPNAPAASSFDLILQAAAGSALGNSGTPYTLTISAIDLTSVTQGWPRPRARPPPEGTRPRCVMTRWSLTWLPGRTRRPTGLACTRGTVRPAHLVYLPRGLAPAQPRSRGRTVRLEQQDLH